MAQMQSLGYSGWFAPLRPLLYDAGLTPEMVGPFDPMLSHIG